MGFYKKTILLSNQISKDKGMAILTIEKTNGGIFGSIKCFDVIKSNNLVLGISSDSKQILKENITLNESGLYSFKLHNDFDLDSKIGCVLAEVYSDVVNVLLWGTNGAKSEYKQNIINTLREEKGVRENVVKKYINTVEAERFKAKQSIDSGQMSMLTPDLFETSENEINKLIDKELENSDFFGLINDQIGDLFAKFPLDEKLGRLVPNSKWVRVDYENNGKEYVLGLIYENDEVRYICYGVPSRFDVEPPPELQPYSQWLQFDGDDGFWVIYQDARTGDSIVIEDVTNL